MMRILIDTNILLAIVPKRSKYHWVYDALRIGKFELVISTEILQEYEERLALFYAPDFAVLVVEEILNLNNIIFAEVYFHWHLITADADDNKFIDAAISSNADHIITHDKHFSVLKTIDFPRVSILTLEAFHLLLEKSG